MYKEYAVNTMMKVCEFNKLLQREFGISSKDLDLDYGIHGNYIAITNQYSIDYSSCKLKMSFTIENTTWCNFTIISTEQFLKTDNNAMASKCIELYQSFRKFHQLAYDLKNYKTPEKTFKTIVYCQNYNKTCDGYIDIIDKDKKENKEDLHDVGFLCSYCSCFTLEATLSPTKNHGSSLRLVK